MNTPAFRRTSPKLVSVICAALLAAVVTGAAQTVHREGDTPEELARSEHPGLQAKSGATFETMLRPPLESLPSMHLPAKISECEAGQCGVWQFSDKGSTARWPSGAQATLTVERFAFDGVTVRRNDTSGSTTGFVAVYTGKVIGNQLMGEVDWFWPGHWNHHNKGKWAATILEPADYNIIDTGISCNAENLISAAEAAERGVIALKNHEAQTGACWLRMSAHGGNATAQGMLATLDYRGIGIPVNLSEAADLAQKSAGQGNYLGERCLSLLYESGQGGLPKDTAKAEYWRDKALQDKLTAEHAQQQEQQHVAQQQQEARGYQAQQAEQQHRASAPRQQFQLNLQNLALLGLLLGNASGNPESRVNQLESQLQRAKDHCYGGSHNPENTAACKSIPGIEEDLRTARGDYDAETQELIDSQKRLSAECKSGNKESCRKLDHVNHELESR